MSDALSGLPDEIRSLIEAETTKNESTLAAIGTEIGAKRDEAKAARTASRIEATWWEAEEAYIGIDDANRHEFGENGRWSKPTTTDAPLYTDDGERDPNKSTVFLRLTSRYVDAGAAKLAEILLPADDKAFSFSETPAPEVIDAKTDESQVVHQGVPLSRPSGPADQGQPGAPPPPRVPLTVKDLANERIEMARKSAKAAETRIYDWMVEGQYTAEVRKVIHDMARIGVGVLKAPTPRSKRLMATKKIEADPAKGIEAGVKVIFQEEIQPVAEWVDPWNFFPDPACGENIHNGAYAFERDFMSARQLRGLKKLPGYIASQIDKVLKEGPEKANLNDNDRGPGAAKSKDRYQVWYFNGMIAADEMNAINSAAGKDPIDDGDDVHAVVTLVNDTVIRAKMNDLESGSLNYHAVPWQRRSQHWAGVGVSEQIREPQRIVNASIRALLDNAGLSAGPQIIVDQSAVRPADGDWSITPRKVWLATNDGTRDVRTAFTIVEIPDITESLERIIELGERFAEETTSIPLITQGQTGQTTPDTLGATQIQNSNATQLLRSIGYAFDDFITEPVVRQFYEWLLLDPDVPNEEKGDWQINAHGSVALVERAIQDQTIGQMGQLVANPIYGFDPKKWAAEYVRSKKLNPDAFKYTEEEQAKLDAAPPQVPPAVQAAQIAADAQLKLGEMKLTADQQSVQSSERIEQAAQVLEGGKVQNEQHRTLVESTVNLHKIQMEHDRMMLQAANARNISLDQLKAELAKTSMSLSVEQQLNASNLAAEAGKHRVDKSVELYKHHTPQPRPPVQVPGRAGRGRAFSQAPAQ